MYRGHFLSKPAAALATRVTAHHAPLRTRVTAASSSLTAVRRATRALSSTAQPPPPDDAKAKEGTGAASEGAAAEPGAEGAAAADYTKELEARIAELQQQLEGKHDQVLRSLAEAENARRTVLAVVDVEGRCAVAIYCPSRPPRLRRASRRIMRRCTRVWPRRHRR